MADKKALTGGSEPSAGPVIELLTSLLEEFRQQVQSKTPKPLEGKALEAVAQFKEIRAALALRRIITLKADPKEIKTNGGNTTLTWTSTGATKVSLKRKFLGGEETLQDLTPPAGGSIEVFVPETSIFIATAESPCGTATATATVTVEGSGVIL